jgi:phosphate transport system protein
VTTTTHSRAEFERQLYLLRADIRSLGELSLQAVERSVRALRQRNIDLAAQVIREDHRIDDLSYALEDRALLLIAKQQPLATDLRTVAAVLFIVAELERIGDYAEGIAKLVVLAGEDPPLKPLIDIPKMADLASDMLQRALNAFVDFDLDTCREIWLRDTEIDNLYNQIYRELLTYMLEKPDTIERATQLTWIAHNLERIGDRVTNICERTAFVITGDARILQHEAELAQM